MKQRYIFTRVFSLLLTGLFSACTQSEKSSQSIGNHNQCPIQLFRSNGNSITCKIYYPEAGTHIDKSNTVDKKSRESYSNSKSYQAKPLPLPKISESKGYQVKPLPPPKISESKGYQAKPLPPPKISESKGYRPK